MNDFIKFRDLVSKNITKMSKGSLFVTDTDRDEIIKVYLDAFEPGTNPVYRERTEHDCSCCKAFIRQAGSVVSIDPATYELTSIWDIEIEGIYKPVAAALSAYVKAKPIRNRLLLPESAVGTRVNFEEIVGKGKVSYDHFHHIFNQKFVMYKSEIGKVQGQHSTKKATLKRALTELTDDSVEAVLELISQGTLYRGDTYLRQLQAFKALKAKYNQLSTFKSDDFCWVSCDDPVVASIRNSAIGTLLIDLSEGKDLDYAVTSYERVVAPTNYKRPTALITKAMIANAEKKVAELGIEDSLYRRLAVAEDITVNNVLFVDRSVKVSGGLFADLSVKPASPKLNKVETVTIEKFITDVLPKVSKVELMLEHKHQKNLMTLIAPVYPSAPSIMQWGNNFSWAYNGDVTDSIKERVKAAGGSVTGIMRCSLSWLNYDDLDIHVVEPNGNHIFFANRGSRGSTGELDVDMNAGGARSRTPVENITWKDRKNLQEGVYMVTVNNYNKRENVDVGFEVEIEFEGKSYLFTYREAVRQTQNVGVAKFKYSHANGIEFLESIGSKPMAGKEVWGLQTGQFVQVDMVMKSPNFWDDQKVGNEHVFFILSGCKTPEAPRGFFNEYLTNDLTEHRKVFEALGHKMRVKLEDNQLSGVGFSTTQREEVLCRVSGAFSRTIKITF